MQLEVLALGSYTYSLQRLKELKTKVPACMSSNLQGLILNHPLLYTPSQKTSSTLLTVT